MQIHRSTLAAFAATIFLTLFAADGSGASAEQGNPPVTVTTPELTDETVPQEAAAPPVAFVNEAIVQPLSNEDAGESAPRPAAASLSDLVIAMPRNATLSRELECLAGAIYFEARGEPLAGQLAVGQVIINRSESGSFPSDYCGVVYQPSQFSFVKGGAMPRINRGSLAWQRASAIARIAHEGLWDGDADQALYFHARRVNPSWSRKKVALATISSHVFYR